ncbi:MAG: hypothetical protein PUC00_09420 [Clostridiales bacterium]|nr:hypothetical protein [Clostridiales bacterium]
MKRLILILLTMMCCTSCTALPAEERAFAVVLLVDRDSSAWRVHGQLPTYRSGGGYLTVTGEGDTLPAALADLEAAAPMHVNLSQLRLLVLTKAVADVGELALVLTTLSDRPDMRPSCAIALTEAPADVLMQALEPATGTRLSKSIDVLLESRLEQGSILPATLAEVLRMGMRQSPVLIAANLRDQQLDLSGGYPLTASFRVCERLTPEETALLSLLTGRTKALRLTLSGMSAQVREASAKVALSQDFQSATVTLRLRVTAASCSPADIETRLADASVTLLSGLSAQGCDVLGLGRQAILHAHDMPAWRSFDWPARCKQLHWRVSVQMSGPT